MGEINIYGIYVPVLLVQAFIAYIVFKLISPLIDRIASKGWIALPSIFNLCFYLGLMLCVQAVVVWFWG